MIKSIHGVIHEPFNRNKLTLLNQQKEILDIIKIHAQQGGFSAVVGKPGVGKRVLKEHMKQLEHERGITVAPCSRTLRTYWHILLQLADSFELDVSEKSLEKELVQ
jgi:energy-coupling factor transporter ATP-binding protein EcfA2